jgi:hypothetical protein
MSGRRCDGGVRPEEKVLRLFSLVDHKGNFFKTKKTTGDNMSGRRGWCDGGVRPEEMTLKFPLIPVCVYSSRSSRSSSINSSMRTHIVV